jgi:hypothetical protein
MCAVKVNLQQRLREVVHQIHLAQQRLGVRTELIFRVTRMTLSAELCGK